MSTQVWFVWGHGWFCTWRRVGETKYSEHSEWDRDGRDSIVLSPTAYAAGNVHLAWTKSKTKQERFYPRLALINISHTVSVSKYKPFSARVARHGFKRCAQHNLWTVHSIQCSAYNIVEVCGVMRDKICERPLLVRSQGPEIVRVNVEVA